MDEDTKQNIQQYIKYYKCNQTTHNNPCLSCRIKQQQFCDKDHSKDTAELLEFLLSELEDSENLIDTYYEALSSNAWNERS